ncbi:MAG: isoamylase early set domain-containing protein [Armatimonadetes bacterium]|nr:isoamylase early set domain-containing protein [Armatimonadota bacterium]
MAQSAKGGTTRKRVAFALHAPEASDVALVGDFNGWDPAARPLKRDESGTWKTTLTLPSGEYQYRYVIDGDWVDDPQCETRLPNEFGTQNCVRIVR